MVTRAVRGRVIKISEMLANAIEAAPLEKLDEFIFAQVSRLIGVDLCEQL